MGKLKYAVASAVSAAIISAVGIVSAQSGMALEKIGYLGDLNLDDNLSAADVIKLDKFLVGSGNLDIPDAYLRTDINKDNKINVFDSIALRRLVLNNELIEIWDENTDPTVPPVTTETQPVTTEPVVTTVTTVTEPIETEQERAIEAPIKAVSASLPSQGDSKLVIFYVDFPDCRYTQDFTDEQIQAIAFGEEDVNNSNYPFESFSAFYSRSSKGIMNLDGQVFRYTAKENQSAYDTDKVKLAEECYDAFNDITDFSQFDGNADGAIDATLFTVPTAAGDTDWWPCAGGFGDGEYRVDGKSIGHIITGNAQIESETNYSNFISSYLHEMGHCMGLPDYYLYNSDDYEGMHGNAGTELMDADAASDFGCFSKLMLGWYGESQVSVYQGGTQEFTLSNAQTNDGNCVIIPYGELDDRYFSEYLMIEYVTEENNNSYINSHMSWWQNVGNGIRIYHIKADLHEGYWFSHLKYQNGSEFTNGDDDGIRLIRLANDAEGGNVFKTGDVIDNSISGFNWYDSNELESIDPGVSVSVGELKDGKYSITVSQKN